MDEETKRLHGKIIDLRAELANADRLIKERNMEIRQLHRECQRHLDALAKKNSHIDTLNRQLKQLTNQ
jgi:chromosome segregation ATPase